MSENYKELQENLNKIIEESDNLELTMFTFELLDCIWCDIVEEEDEEICESLIEAYENEVRNSLEIMNPDLKIDIDVLEKVLNYMILARN
jgi:SAM-dependent MidA family methyltransferase